MKTNLRSGLALLAAVSLAAGPAWAAGLDQAQVRAFVARQERAWNSGALDAFFAAFRPDAVFTDQYRTPSGQLVPYGSSDLAKARSQTRKFRAGAKISETGRIEHIALAADGRSAEVVSHVVARTQGAQGVRVSCAERHQQLVLGPDGLRSKGQTDTYARCPR